MNDGRDKRDPELLGLAILATGGTGAIGTASQRADRIDLSVPDYGTPECEQHRLSFNGKVDHGPRRPPAEPTHGMDEPPNLVDEAECLLTTREDPPGSQNFVAWCTTHQCVHTGPRSAPHVVAVDLATMKATAPSVPLSCPECGEARTVIGRWTFCENMKCGRYEEPVR